MLAADDPEVVRAMATMATLPPRQQTEVIRTVYRYVYAYRRTRHPNTLIELVNSLIATIVLRTNPGYLRTVHQLDTADGRRPPTRAVAP
jgi:hypothetical protein